MPKKDLVGVLQVMLRGRRRKVAPELPAATVRVHALSTFYVRPVPLTADLVASRRAAPQDGPGARGRRRRVAG